MRETRDAGNPIEDLLIEYLRRREAGEERVLDSLCTRHPEQADLLRVRAADIEAAEKLVPGLLIDQPVQKRIGHYTLLRELGRGGMGVVYLALDNRLERFVALKMLSNRFSTSGKSFERFRREQRAIAHLSHPGIIPIYEIGEEQGQPYFTMEYVDGRTLSDMLQELRKLDRPVEELTGLDLRRTLEGEDEREHTEEETADWEEGVHLGRAGWGGSYVEAVARLILQVAEALAHAHENEVIHRDVKPSNLLVRRSGRVDLFDFGLARLAGEQSMTLTGEFAGTPSYVSPEQVAARRMGIDQRTDVYSLGVTLYEMLALRVPFQGETTEQVFKQILVKEPTPPHRVNSAVASDLETICLTAMEKDPDRRYASAGELADDLRRFLEFHPIQARPVGALTRMSRFVRRHRAASLASALALLIAVGAPSLFWALERGHSRQERQLKNEASESFEMARNAVEQMLTRVAEVDLAERPGLGPLQRKLLDDALTFHRRFLDRRRADPRVSLDVARSLVGLGNITDRLGQPEKAEPAYREALDILARLPEQSDATEWTARAHMGLGKLLWDRGRTEDALAAYRQTLGLRRSLLRSAPESSRRRWEVASILANLGASQTDLGEFETAQRHFEQALDLYRPEDLAETDVLESWAWAQSRYAVLLIERQEPRAALEMLQSLLDHLTPIANEARTARIRSALSLAYEGRGMLSWYRAETPASSLLAISRDLLLLSSPHRVRSDSLTKATRALLESAREDLTRARQITESLNLDFPQAGEHVVELGRILSNLALIQGHLGEEIESRRLLESAQTSLENLAQASASSSSWRLSVTLASIERSRARSLCDRGDFTRAIEHLRSATSRLRGASTSQPRVQDHLFGTQIDLAQLLSRNDQLDEADQVYVQADAVLSEVATNENRQDAVEEQKALVLLARLDIWIRTKDLATAIERVDAVKESLAHPEEILREYRTRRYQLADRILAHAGLTPDYYRWAGPEVESPSAEDLMRAGIAAFRLGQLAEAIRLIGESDKRSLDPLASTLATLARAHHRAGNAEEASENLEKLARLVEEKTAYDDNPNEAIRFLALVLAEMGEHDQVQKWQKRHPAAFKSSDSVSAGVLEELTASMAK